jgi:addiction module RelE/StbE family toxin
MTLSFTKTFIKQAKKLSPALKKQLQNRIELFINNPLDPNLHNHHLVGKYRNYRSINISGDLRALYLQKDNEAIFDVIGTHSELYG